MSEVTVKANQPALGLPDGAIVTVERTARVDGAINAGILTVVGDAAVEPLGDAAVEPLDEPVRTPDKLPEPPDDATEPIGETDTLPDDVEPTKPRAPRGKSRT